MSLVSSEPRPDAAEPTPAERARQAGAPSLVERKAAAVARRGPQGTAAAARTMARRPDGSLDPLAAAVLLAGGSHVAARMLAPALTASASSIARALIDEAEVVSSTARLSVAEAIAVRCAAHGVTKAFAYPGTSELALCHAWGALGGGALVNARGDAEAVFMAGGAAMGRGLAAAIVHGARGLTNAAGAVGDLRRNELAALVIVGQPSTRSAPFLPPHAEPDLIPAVATFAKQGRELAWPASGRDALDPVGAVDAAMGLALSHPRGPVLVGVPQDILESRVVEVADTLRPLPGLRSAEPASGAVRQAASLLAAAGRVVVLVDDYFLHHLGAVDALADFAGTGATVYQVRHRRGPMLFQRVPTGRVPGFAGWYDPGDPAHRRALDAADVLVTIEDRNLYTRVVGDLPQCPKVAITSDAGKTRKNGYLTADDIVLEAAPAHALRHLVRACADTRPASGRAAAATRQHPEPGTESTAGPMARALASAVRGALGLIGADMVVDDSQMLGGLLAERYDDAFGTAAVRGDHGGFVGAGLPSATGLAISSGQPVLCLLGDQAFTNGFGGLVAAAQEAAPVLFFVCNNGESTSLRKQARASALDPSNEDFDRVLRNCPTFDYVDAARAAGLGAERVDLRPTWRDDPAAAAQLVLEAAAAVWRRGRPALVEIVVPSLGPAWQGVWATRGHDEAPQASAGARTGVGRASGEQP